MPEKTYTIEHHKVWTYTVEACSRKEALEKAEELINDEVDAEETNYTVVKRPQ